MRGQRVESCAREWHDVVFVRGLGRRSLSCGPGWSSDVRGDLSVDHIRTGICDVGGGDLWRDVAWLDVLCLALVEYFTHGR